MKRTSGNAVAISIPLIVIVVIGVLVAVFWNKIYDTSQKHADVISSEDQSEASPQDSIDDTPPKPAKTGTISGTIRYPIEWMSLEDRNKGMTFPEDMEVCALDASTYSEVACETDVKDESYALTLEPGSYVIRATADGKTAYYDPYVSSNDSGYWPMDGCSEEASTPIVLQLGVDEELTQINAADFWVGHLGC